MRCSVPLPINSLPVLGAWWSLPGAAEKMELAGCMSTAKGSPKTRRPFILLIMSRPVLCTLEPSWAAQINDSVRLRRNSQMCVYMTLRYPMQRYVIYFPRRLRGIKPRRRCRPGCKRDWPCPTPRRAANGVLLESRVMLDEDMHWAYSPAEADAILQRIKAAGFNVYVPCIYHGGGSWYP